MKKGFILFAACVGIATATQWAVIRYLPNLVHAIALHRMKRKNEWVKANRTDAGMRRVVLPNPDFVYSALFYDVSDHDIVVSGILPDTGYASIAFYDDRCQPYYVYNNLPASHKGRFTFVLSRKKEDTDNRIQAKTVTGEIICRFLLDADSSFARIKNLQSQLSCSPR